MKKILIFLGALLVVTLFYAMDNEKTEAWDAVTEQYINNVKKEIEECYGVIDDLKSENFFQNMPFLLDFHYHLGQLETLCRFGYINPGDKVYSFLTESVEQKNKDIGILDTHHNSLNEERKE